MSAFHGKSPDTLKILQEFLQAAVPLWIMRFKDLPWEDLQQIMKESEKVLEESGELAVFVQVKRGETARIFNSVAKAIAALSFVPGGIEIFNRHFETKYEGPAMGSGVKGPKDLRDRVICVDPWFIAAPHQITDIQKFRDIVSSMRENGWQGRPLIAVPIDRKHYQASTGSHRHAAALEVSIPKIPILPLNREELAILKKGLGYDVRDHPLWDYTKGREILYRHDRRALGDLLRMDIVTDNLETSIPGIKPWEPEALEFYSRMGFGDPETLEFMAVEKWPCR